MAVAVHAYRRLLVPAPLRAVADHVWVARHDGVRPHDEVLLPDGRGLLLVVAGTGGRVVDPLTGASTPDHDGLRGAWTRVALAEQTGPVVRLGVQLHPLGAARLRGGRAAADTWWPVTDVLAADVLGDVRAHLDAGHDDAAVAAVLAALEGHPRAIGADLDRLEDALRFVDEHRGLVRAADVARAAGAAPGELHRWCTRLLGTSPAQYLAAVRFSTFVRDAVGGGPVDVAEALAVMEWYLAAGHRAREVERFTGLAPAELRRLAEHLRDRLP